MLVLIFIEFIEIFIFGDVRFFSEFKVLSKVIFLQLANFILRTL